MEDEGDADERDVCRGWDADADGRYAHWYFARQDETNVPIPHNCATMKRHPSAFAAPAGIRHILKERTAEVMANIKEIARLAGVSVSTVSRVLNSHPYVRADKREAVLSTIEKLNYSRNMNAVHLITGRTRSIAVVVPFISFYYFSVILEGIAHEALGRQYRLVLCQTDYRPEEERKVLDMLRDKEIDGVILASTALEPTEIEAYTAYGPIVALRDAEDITFSSVCLDHYAAFRSGLRYLASKGCRTAGYCEGRKNGFSSSLRQAAYRDHCLEAGLPVREDWLFFDYFGEEDGARLLHELLAMPERPAALIVAGDHIAAGLVLEARKCGLQIPGDLAVMGFDDQPIGRLLGITTIDNRLYETGQAAFRLLYARIDNPDIAPERLVLGHRILERGSVVPQEV